jgi:hypothetical protein
MKLTKESLAKHHPCADGYAWYLTNGEPKTVQNTVEKLITSKNANRLSWSNWLLSRVLSHDKKIQYAIFAAEQVLEIFEKKYPSDQRPRRAIKAAKHYLKNRSASDAASAAASAADKEKVPLSIINYGLSILED